MNLKNILTAFQSKKDFVENMYKAVQQCKNTLNLKSNPLLSEIAKTDFASDGQYYLQQATMYKKALQECIDNQAKTHTKLHELTLTIKSYQSDSEAQLREAEDFVRGCREFRSNLDD